MLKGKLLGTSILKGKIQREVITISKEEQEVVIEPRREQFDVYPDVGKVIKKATVKAVTSDIDENITARNIRGGVTILGVTGDLEPDKPDQSKVVEPSTSEQVITADSGYELASVTIRPVTAEIDSDIVAENIRKDTEILGVVGTMEAREDLDTELAEQETLIAELENGVNELPDKPVDKLQWKFDNVKTADHVCSCRYRMTQEQMITLMKGLDTSKVECMDYMFEAESLNSAYYGIKDLSQINIDASNCKTMYKMFSWQYGLTVMPEIKNVSSKLENTEYMFNYCQYLTYETVKQLEQWDTSGLKRTGNMYQICDNLDKAPKINTQNVTYFQNMYYGCYKLEDVEMDMRSANSVSSVFFNCRALKNLILKNINRSLVIGSGTSYGTLLTDESIINTFQELWDMTGSSAKTLTMSTPSKARTDEIYVKLIDITDEMRVEDEYIDNKKPCVVCESTDEGAMTLKEYGISKNWNIA